MTMIMNIDRYKQIIYRYADRYIGGRYIIDR